MVWILGLGVGARIEAVPGSAPLSCGYAWSSVVAFSWGLQHDGFGVLAEDAAQRIGDFADRSVGFDGGSNRGH